MKQEKIKSGNKPLSGKATLTAAELRAQAEEQLKAQKLKAAKLPETDTERRRIVHELQVHQIELEMQNEELAQSRAELEIALQQYTELYDFAPIGYCTLTPDGTIKRVNFAGALLLGLVRGQIINRRIGVFVALKHRPVFSAILIRVFEHHKAERCEVELKVDEASDPAWVHIEARSSDGGQECYVAFSDITDRKKAEASAREAGNAREILIQNLQFALDNKKTFQGVIPICATCKKIRDQKGEWTQIEEYLSKHTDVSFTHGICPDCATKFFEEGT